LKKLKRFGKDNLAFGLADRGKPGNRKPKQPHFSSIRSAPLIPMAAKIGLRLGGLNKNRKPESKKNYTLELSDDWF
jgi:hypothetical protein